MQTDYAERPTHHQLDREIMVEPENPVSISRFVQVLRRYRPAIALAVIGTALAYLIIAVAVLLFSPVERITTQTFRLDFEGAGKGEYPNKTKFNIADIMGGPIPPRVWQD